MLKGVNLGGKAVGCLRECELEQDVMEEPPRRLLFEQTTHPLGQLEVNSFKAKIKRHWEREMTFVRARKQVHL